MSNNMHMTYLFSIAKFSWYLWNSTLGLNSSIDIALYVADLSSITSISYIPRAWQKWFARADPGVSSEHHQVWPPSKNKQKNKFYFNYLETKDLAKITLDTLFQSIFILKELKSQL